MISRADVSRAATHRFAGMLGAGIVAVVLMDVVLSGDLGRLRQVHWPVAAGEVVAAAIGYGGGLLALRRHVHEHDLEARRVAYAAVVAVVVLLVLTMVDQPARVGRIALLSVCAGAAAAVFTVSASAVRRHRAAPAV